MSAPMAVTPARVEPSVKLRKRLRDRLRRGQQMVEYSVVSHFILIGGGTTMLLLISKLFDSLTTFYKAVYMVLETSGL